jgi:putative endonuclease
MMSDRYRGGIYTGVTADTSRRIYQHRTGTGSKFVREYGFLHLVQAEPYERIDEAIAREKAIKKWRREWKVSLIEKGNPDWLDLYKHLIGA